MGENQLVPWPFLSTFAIGALGLARRSRLFVPGDNTSVRSYTNFGSTAHGRVWKTKNNPRPHGRNEFHMSSTWVQHEFNKQNWLVVWNIFHFPIQLGMSSSQLTHIFQRGCWNHQQTEDWWRHHNWHHNSCPLPRFFCRHRVRFDLGGAPKPAPRNRSINFPISFHLHVPYCFFCSILFLMTLLKQKHEKYCFFWSKNTSTL